MYTVKMENSKELGLKGRKVMVFIGSDSVKSDRMTLGMTEVPPNSVMDPHVHEDKEELIFVIEGKGEVVIDGKREELDPYTAAIFPLGLVHQVFNNNDMPLRFMFVFNPPNDFSSAR